MRFTFNSVLTFIVPPVVVCGILGIFTILQGEPPYAGEGPLSMSWTELVASRALLVILFIVIYFFIGFYYILYLNNTRLLHYSAVTFLSVLIAVVLFVVFFASWVFN